MNSGDNLLSVVLDSWDRNNRILVNLLRAIPQGGLEVRATPSSQNIGAVFAHLHYVRLVFVSEDAPEFAVPVPLEEWQRYGHDREQMAELLNQSAKVVGTAVEGRIASGRPMELHFDHPILFLQHMIWHEGYHHGQIKLALKQAGMPIPNEVAGPLTWRVWMNKTH